MAILRVGFIGTGKKLAKPGPMGYGMAHQHALAWQALPKGEAEIVACADIVKENADAFCDTWNVPKRGAYTDYGQMLEREKLDVISICTWPKLHAPMVIACAKARVKGIYCEKPMADSWGAAKAMHAACVENGVRLAFNHQRRYGKPFSLAKKFIVEGRIGKLERIEFGAGNLCDYGSHNFDMCNYFNGDESAKWLIAQIDYRTENLTFGAHQENQALAQWQYANGVFGFLSTGAGKPMVGAHHKAIGSEGVIEIGTAGPDEHSRPLRFRTQGMNIWEYIDTAGESCHGPGFIERAIADFTACLKAGRDCQLSSHNALKATELIFAAFHSSRVHGRVDLPLAADDNALEAMVADGTLQPRKSN